MQELGDLLAHPIVVTLFAAWVGNRTIRKFIPSKKDSIISEFAVIKHLFLEVEILYDRIVDTTKSVQDMIDKEVENVEEYKKIADDVFEKDFKRMSAILNDTIPIKWAILKSNIAIYMEDATFFKVTEDYFQEYKKIYHFVVHDLPGHADLYQKKLAELEELQFDELRRLEEEWISTFAKSRSRKILDK